MAAAATVVSAGIGAAVSSSNAKKARKANSAALAAGDKAGAFEALELPAPSKMDVPSADEILVSWRNNVNANFPEYDKIAGKQNVSEQAAARVANQSQNPQYYPLLEQASTNAAQASRGVIPKDVKQNMLRTANEDAYLRGFSYGTDGGGAKTFAGGNDAAANLALRNIGLTSLDLMKWGETATGNVLAQSRAGRGQIISAKDTVPTAQIFQDQMNASAIADYNFATDTAAYKAGTANAPIQAAYNKLALQMGVQGQNNALTAQTSAQNTQLALSAMQALGQAYGGSSTIGSTTRGTGSNGAVNTAMGTGADAVFGTSTSVGATGYPTTAWNQDPSKASTIRGTV